MRTFEGFFFGLSDSVELSRLRRDAKFVTGFSTLLAERSRMKKLLGLKKTNSQLRELARARRVGGEKLTAAAVLLLATPDPLTGLASLPLFAAAQLVKSNEKTSDLGRVYAKANNDLSALFSSQFSFL